ncbi:8-oxo-dGTP diphosphatase [Subtercola lobariae]|uniref:8-oxo-dGTP diphosphatase n=1 Tax=Subtercola lobariae TaxID=1588641 RepID=UPI0027DBAA09|nr:NUDIX domain-containing protein [Subtercola lobariae]
MAGYEVCVCYLTRVRAGGRREVLLGRKRTGLGVGKIVGPGGKVEAGESPLEAIVREVAEETGTRVAPGDLRAAGRLEYRFPFRPGWSQNSNVFVGEVWQGEPVGSDELAPEWFAVDELPLDEMWHDARFWLPAVLAGDEVRAWFSFGADNETVAESSLPLG